MDPQWNAERLFELEDPDTVRVQGRSVFAALFEAGDGWNVGGEDADSNDLEDDLGAALWVEAITSDDVAVYRTHDGCAILVGHPEGEVDLWAVELLPSLERNLWMDQEFEDLQDTENRNEPTDEGTGWLGGERPES